MFPLLVFATLMYAKLSCGITFSEIADKHATEGQRVVWNCAVNDLGTGQRLEWSGYDASNEDIKHEYSESALQTTLVFESVSRTDEGHYRCVVTDGQGKVVLRSEDATLTVTKMPLLIYPECGPRKTLYKVNEDAEIWCMSEETEPIVKLRWTQNDETFSVENSKIRDGFVRIHYKFRVTIDHDKAVFKCDMSSSIELPNSPRTCKIGPLDVQYKPIVSIPPVNITVSSKAIVMCKAEANPSTITYTWDTSTKFKYKMLTEHVMEISDPDKKLNGTVITCFAENSIGSSQATFVVRLPPDLNTGGVGPVVGGPEVPESSVSVLSTVLLIAGSCTMLALLLMILPLCYCFFSPRHNLDYFGRFVPQPEVYFQPKELETTTEHETPARRVWKRSCAVQVPEDISSFYAELPCGRGGDDEFVENV